MKFKTIIKWTFRILLLVFVIIQFIRPARNNGNVHGPDDLSQVINIPQNVETILQDACYDCHSNGSTYPWYTNIQPVGWWMQRHVDEGKESLNFSEFKTYDREDWAHVLDECVEMVEENKMPLPSYTWTHGKLDENQKRIFINWAQKAMDGIAVEEE
ncbi:MAG TPA: heme-binding domain-containing protein [Flavobacteriales bacterium]|nr:heme-binding domain-containing protein [Flavobacteriales bacterium]